MGGIYGGDEREHMQVVVVLEGWNDAPQRQQVRGAGVTGMIVWVGVREGVVDAKGLERWTISVR